MEHVYTGGVKKLAALPAVTRSAPLTQAIDRTLKDLAKAYGSLALDAHSLRKQRYASELTVIERAEHTLRQETAELS